MGFVYLIFGCGRGEALVGEGEEEGVEVEVEGCEGEGVGEEVSGSYGGRGCEG